MRIEQGLLQAAKAGDPSAMARLLQQVRPDVHRYAAHTCGRASAVEEVVQESLFIVSRRVHQLRDPGAFVGWVFAIVSRVCLWPALALRRRLMVSREDDHVGEMRGSDTLRMDLARAFESLSDSDRGVLMMRDIEGRTIGEMAARLGITRAATKSRLHRARRLVREYLAGG